MDAPSATPLTFVDTNVFYWWVASDLPAGTVSTGWVDRIHGMRLANDTAANRPTVVSNYVKFDASLNSGNGQYLSNKYPASIVQDWAIGMIVSAPGPWSTIACVFDRDVNETSFPGGWYFRDTTKFYEKNLNAWEFKDFTNGIIFDLVIVKTNGAFLENVYTNGVFYSSWNYGGGGFDLSGGVGLGNAGNLGRPFTGKIYEVAVWTNAAVNSHLTVSNYHRYRTNTYGTYIPP